MKRITFMSLSLPLDAIQPFLHQSLLFPSSWYHEWLDRQRWLTLTIRATCALKVWYEHLLRDPCKMEVVLSIELICKLWSHQFDRVCFVSRRCFDSTALQCSENMIWKFCCLYICFILNLCPYDLIISTFLVYLP